MLQYFLPSFIRATRQLSLVLFCSRSQTFTREIILVLLSSGDAYLIDLRQEHRERYELVEVFDDEDEDANTRWVMLCRIRIFDSFKSLCPSLQISYDICHL
jgi:hypothetical protein